MLVLFIKPVPLALKDTFQSFLTRFPIDQLKASVISAVEVKSAELNKS